MYTYKTHMESDYLMLNDDCPAATVNAPNTERELAILFLDIRNFTGLMESQQGQSVNQIVRRLFTAFNLSRPAIACYFD